MSEKAPRPEQIEEKFYEGLIELKPETIKDNTPTIWVPGWSNTTESLAPALKRLSALGRDVISFNHSRETLLKNTGVEMSEAELQKVIALLQVIEDRELTQVDAVAFSEGAINTVIAASLYPEKFRSIVLVSPAGMIGGTERDSFLKLTGRFQAEGLEEARHSLLDSRRRPDFIKHLIEQQKYIAQNPLLAIRETAAIAKANIYQRLKEIHSQGVKISILVGKHDKLFPREEIEALAQIGVHFDFYDVMPHGHHESILSENYPVAIDETLTAMNHNGEQH